MTQRMILNETAWFGAGALRHLPEEVQRRGMRKALIVTDKALVAAGALKRVTDLLAQHQLTGRCMMRWCRILPFGLCSRVLRCSESQVPTT